MRKGKKLTFLVTVLCTLALLMSLFSITPFAASATADDTTNKVTATTTTTVKQGDVVNCYVYIDSIESLSSLNVAVHFDPDKVSVTSSFNSASCALYDSSINESYVQFSYIFDGNGEDTKTQLFYFQYKVLTNAEEGAAHFDIVVSEAYDSSLNVANISGSRCPFTIAKKVTSKTCTVYGTSPVSTAIKEEFELSYRLNTTGVASGSFVIRYDAELFEFIECSLGGLLENKFYDIKTDQPGIIYVSFVGTEYSSNSQLLSVKFKTIRNATQTSQIKLSVTDFYDLELNSIGCNGYTTNVNLTYDPTYSDDAPTMTVSTVYSAEKQQVTVTIKLDAESYLGAGDFVLNFNTEYFTYNSATKGFVPTFFNINDKKASEGIVKFSIISMSDIMTEETVLTVILDTPVFCNDVIADFDIGGSGLSDSMTNPILINFVDFSLSISGVGHDLISHPAQAPTCTEIGWYAYATCSRCDYTTYEEIPANGHSYVHTICTVCDDKQPVFRSWDVSAAGDGSVMANLYENVVDGGYELEIAGLGAMVDWTSTSNVPWYNAYRSQINYLIIEDGITSIGARAFYGCTALTSAIIPNNVETIGYSAFYGCSNLSSVTFGTSVKTVGNYAFYGCTSLTSVVLPNSIETIGEYAFYNCTSISELSLGTSVTTIGTYAFGNCSALTDITIPEKVTSIGNGAFANCYLVNEINFNATAMNDLEYNNNVFFNVGINGTGIEVTIGSKVTKIPAYLFYSTSNGTSYLPKITSVAFENGSVCESIGIYAFYYADEVTSIALPNSVKRIGNYAFAYCTTLVSVDVCNSLETIGANAFYNCYALESITIPDTVTTISTYAFYNCKALTEIIFHATAMADLANNNYVFYNAGVDGDGISVLIGKNVTRIPSYLFYSTSNNTSYLPKITSVIFEDSSVCKSIGTYAFYYSKNLVEVSLPEGMETIERSAFYYCSNLLRVMIPDTVTQIDTYAFYGCTKAIIGFESDALPTTLGSSWYSSEASYYLNVKQFAIVEDALYVIFNDDTAVFAKYYGTAAEYQILETVEGISVTAIGSNAFRNNTTIESVTIPDAVTQINAYAFYGCSALKSITIPKSITTIGKYAFYNCTNVEEIVFNAIFMDDLAYENYVFYNNGKNTEGISVTIGAEVTKIPAYLFRSAHDDSYNPKITSIIFAENSVCESIGGCSFYGLDYLTTIIIPESVTSIASHVMSYCSKLTIGFEAAEAPETLGSYWNADSGYYLNVKEFVIYDDATYVITNDGKAILGRYFGTAAQYEILEEVNGITVAAIGDYAFYQNKTLNNVEISSNVTSVGNNAFYYCTDMTDVVLPNGLLTIGNNAFYGCSALTTILIPETVTNIGSSAFNSCSKLTIGFASETQNATLGSSWSGDSGYYLNVKEFVVYDDATYVVTNDNTAALGRYYGTATEYAILESVNGASVTIVGKGAFRNVSSLVNVSIPNTVTRIENNAFYYCTALESITIPENVVHIGNYAFYYTRALTEINFDAIAVNDLSTGNYIFYCSGQAGEGIKVTIGAQVTKIPNCLFYPRSSATYLPKITEFVFEEGSVCKIIGAYTFAYNTNLSSIILPEGVEVIGSYAFANTNIETIVIPDSVTTINSYAFNNCANLATVHMPSALTSIGAYAFYNCSLLSEIVIPEGVTTIDGCAFQNVGFKLVYICSDKIAYNANSSSACGYLLDGVSSVVIRSDIELISNYIAENYTNIEAITYQGSDYVIYSVHEHSWSEHQVLVPYIACEQDGCIRYVCSDCGAYKDVTTFKHDVIINAAKEPDCTNVGWHEYHTCSKCAYTTYTEIPALGHRVLVDGRIWVDSITTENDSTYPFILKDGVYSSTNHSDYTESYFTITALYDCTLNVSYAISSEQNYDKIIIRVNGTIVVEISGQVDWQSKTIELNAGDIVTINYHKDSSNAVGEDTGWFSFTCEQTQIGALVPGPAADAEPTCTEAVVCHFCQTLIKEALGHDEIAHSAKTPTCTEIGWNAYVTCSRCDYTTYVEIPANGHSYGEWIEILAPTCTVVGTERRDCDDCDHYETRDIAVLGHDEIDHDAKASTCTEIGWHAYVTCSRCDYSTYVEIAALGHDEIGHSAKEPTCTAIGWYEYVTCSRCDYTTYVERSALGHDTINHEAQAPACTEIGWYAYDTCSRCAYTTYVEIAATGHSYADKICVNCGEDQPASYTWDISENADGSVMAYCYALTDGNYLMEIVGSGAMKDWTGSAPWYNIRSKIKTVKIEEGVTSIGAYAFIYCESLENIDIPEGVTKIGTGAFEYCHSLTLIYLPDSLDYLDDYVFYESKKLTIIINGDDMPDNLGSIWNYGCGYYLNPQKVIVNDDSTYVIDQNGIGYLAKYYGDESSYEVLELVDGVEITRIGDFAFNNSTQMLVYSVPQNIEYIGRYAFRGCRKLVIVFESEILPERGGSWNDNCPYYVTPKNIIHQDGFIFVLTQNDELHMSKYYGTEQNIIVPNECNGIPVTHIGDYAFYSLYNITEVTLPNNIVSIGVYAFGACTSLEQVNLSQVLTSIGSSSFSQCYKLHNVEIPNSVTTIGNSAFWHCENLEYIRIPSTVQNIGSSAFSYCYKLGVIYCESEEIANKMVNTSSCGNILNNATTLIVPNGTTAQNFLTEIYPISEVALIDGEYYIIYSLDEHTWVGSTIIEMEECVVDGLIHHTCSDCGVRKDTVIPCHDKIHHDAKAPSCTEIGWHTYETCSRCNYTTYVEIAANGHSYSEWVEILAPTCSVKGTDRRDCDNCDHYETRDIAALGHDEVAHDAKTVTCTAIGWNACVTCTRCDYTTYAEIPATGHSYGEWVETLAPTCLTKGSDRRDCKDCDHYEVRDVAALGHDEVSHNAKAVTCTAIGWNAYVTCTRCDYTTYVEIPAMGHTPSDWIIDEEATYEADGSKHKECTVCHEVLETSTIPMLTHSYVSVMAEHIRYIVFLLPFDERELIEALFFKGYSERQWSKISGIPQRTICYRKNVILQKLKKILKKSKFICSTPSLNRQRK